MRPPFFKRSAIPWWWCGGTAFMILLFMIPNPRPSLTRDLICIAIMVLYLIFVTWHILRFPYEEDDQ